MKIPVQGGTQANYTGTVLEKFVQQRLDERGYTYVKPQKFNPARYMEQPIYTKRLHIGMNIYDTDMYCDLILYHPTKWPDNLIIECKWQQSNGSVDEKYPFLVLNITMRYPCPSLVLLDGSGYRAGAEKWLRKQSGNGNFLHVFSMAEFSKWANQGKI